MNRKLNSKPDDFEIQFREMVKNVIKEEDYLKAEDFKNMIKDILNEIEPLIAKKIKEHVSELAKYTIEQMTTK